MLAIGRTVVSAWSGTCLSFGSTSRLLLDFNKVDLDTAHCACACCAFPAWFVSVAGLEFVVCAQLRQIQKLKELIAFTQKRFDAMTGSQIGRSETCRGA